MFTTTTATPETKSQPHQHGLAVLIQHEDLTAIKTRGLRILRNFTQDSFFLVRFFFPAIQGESHRVRTQRITAWRAHAAFPAHAVPGRQQGPKW